VAFLAYNQILPASFAATETSPGSAFMEAERMATEVRAARERADVVVVSCHWGVEYSAYPNSFQQQMAGVLADAGADLILGHHPHVLQGLGYLNDAFVAYSLGNFCFYHGPTPETVETVVLRCLVDASGVKTVELIPAFITDGQPALASSEVADRILSRIHRVTASQGAFPQPRE
jgi:poly-gamma-glutamate synthesis protein (capsule biosynthesis protein)